VKSDDFYERNRVTHEIIHAKRSEICYNLITDLITNKINCGEKAKILDLGCGDGKFIAKFGKRCEIFGVDVSSKAVELAKKSDVNAYKADISCEKLPFENEYFDIIYFGDVIEHLIDPDFAINEVVRVIKRNGFLVLSTPNLACWLNRLLLLLGMQPLFSEVSTNKIFGRSGSFPVGHLRLFTYRALQEFLAYYQFRIIRTMGAPFDRLPRLVKKLDVVFSRIPSLSSIVVVVACVNRWEG